MHGTTNYTFTNCLNQLCRVALLNTLLTLNKMVREPNVSPHKQIIKDDDVHVKEYISTK